jgi:hypothetical protein
MRREQRLGGAARAGLAQVRVLRDQVERVGVDDAGNVARQHRAQQRFRAIALAEARADDDRIQVEPEHFVGVAEHQLGHRAVEERRLVQHADVDAARRRVSAPRVRRAGLRPHARRAADHASEPASPCGSCSAGLRLGEQALGDRDPWKWAAQ